MITNERGGLLLCCPRILFIDLDGTVWNCLDISLLTPPFTRINENEIIDSSGVIVKLFPKVRDFLKWAKNAGLYVASLSWNIREIAVEALKAFNIYELFDNHYIEFHPHKGIVMKKAINEIKTIIRYEVKPCNIVYIDDRTIHLDEVKREVGNVVFIHMWKNFKDYDEVRRFLEKLIQEECMY